MGQGGHRSHEERFFLCLIAEETWEIIPKEMINKTIMRNKMAMEVEILGLIHSRLVFQLSNERVIPRNFLYMSLLVKESFKLLISPMPRKVVTA